MSAETHKALTLDGRQAVVSIKWAAIGDRFEPTSITVASSDGLPVTADLVRRLPLGSVVADSQPAMVPLPISEQWNHSPARGQQRPDDMLRVVASVYRSARAERRSVTKAVALETNCSISTAGKRIMAARKRGLLAVPHVG